MEDGTGAVVTLPTFPQLQKDVTDLTDAATGAVAGAQAAATTSQASAALAQADAVTAQDAKEAAAASARDADDSELAAAASAAAALVSEGASSASAAFADSRALVADASASAAAVSEGAAASSATTAASSSTAASTSADEAEAWALTAQSTVTGILHYMGAWSAAGGSFPLEPIKGAFWKISEAGTVGGVALAVGDQIIYSGTGWDKIDNTETVTSVAGRVGAVQLSLSDVDGVQAALDEKLGNTGGAVDGPVTVSRLTVSSAAEAGVELRSSSGGRAINLIQSAAGNTGLYEVGVGYLLSVNTLNDGYIAGGFELGTGVLSSASAAGVSIRPSGRDSLVGQFAVATSGEVQTAGNVRVTTPGGEASVGLEPTGGRRVRLLSNSTPNIGLYEYDGGGWLMRIDGSNDTVFAGSVTAADHINSSSDRRLKHRITTRQARTRLADTLRLCDFLWNHNGKADVSVIAQATQYVAPEYVHEFEHKDGKRLSVDKAGLALECVIGLAERVRELERPWWRRLWSL